MDEFDALFSALEDFVNDSQYLHSGVGGGLHPGEPLLALAISAKRSLQKGGQLPVATMEEEALAERLAHVANDSWALNDQLRDDLRCAAKIIAK